MQADDLHQPLARRFQALWLAIYSYSLDYQLEMAFLEQYESLPANKELENQTLGGLIDELKAQDMIKTLPLEGQALYRLIADLQTQGLLKDLPLAVIGEFTLGVGLKLARQVNAGQVKLAPDSLSLIAQACWDSISR